MRRSDGTMRWIRDCQAVSSPRTWRVCTPGLGASSDSFLNGDGCDYFKKLYTDVLVEALRYGYNYQHQLLKQKCCP